jgi:hypothetical protein
MVSVHFQTSKQTTITTIPDKKTKQNDFRMAEDAPSSLLIRYMQKLSRDNFNLTQLSLVDDNARIHRTQSYFRTELTSTEPPATWSPNDPVVGSARTTKDRWGVQGIHKKVLDEMKIEEEESSSEFFIKKPNRRSSIDYDNFDFYQYEKSPASRSDSVLPSTQHEQNNTNTTNKTNPKKSWETLLNRSDSVRRISNSSLTTDSVLRKPTRGLSPVPTSMPPAPPLRALSPPRSSSRKDRASTSLKLLGTATSVASYDGPLDFDYEVPFSEEEEEEEEQQQPHTPSQSPRPTDASIVRSSNDTTVEASGSSNGSFQRRPPTHTNSFELTHRRSARRSSIKRRVVKMTQQDLQSRILDILLLDDNDETEDSTIPQLASYVG